MWLVQVLCDPVELLVAQAPPISALNADVVGILARALIGTYDGVVAVDGSGHAGPDAPGAIAAFNKGFAAREGVVHGSTFAFVEHGRPAAFAAGHGAIIIVLRQPIR